MFFRLLEVNYAFKVKNTEFGKKIKKKGHESMTERIIPRLFVDRLRSSAPIPRSAREELQALVHRAHSSATYALAPFLGFQTLEAPINTMLSFKRKKGCREQIFYSFSPF